MQDSYHYSDLPYSRPIIAKVLKELTLDHNTHIHNGRRKRFFTSQEYDLIVNALDERALEAKKSLSESGKKSYKDYNCELCPEDDASKFHSSHKSICRLCYNKRVRDKRREHRKLNPVAIGRPKRIKLTVTERINNYWETNNETLSH